MDFKINSEWFKQQASRQYEERYLKSSMNNWKKLKNDLIKFWFAWIITIGLGLGLLALLRDFEGAGLLIRAVASLILFYLRLKIAGTFYELLGERNVFFKILFSFVAYIPLVGEILIFILYLRRFFGGRAKGLDKNEIDGSFLISKPIFISILALEFIYLILISKHATRYYDDDILGIVYLGILIPVMGVMLYIKRFHALYFKWICICWTALNLTAWQGRRDFFNAFDVLETNWFFCLSSIIPWLLYFSRKDFKKF